MAEYRIEGLCKSFWLHGKAHKVLENVRLCADTQELTVILGRSGCGKTTLLRILCGLESADCGTLHLPKRERLRVVFQESRLMPWLTTEENICFGVEKSQRSPQKTAEMMRLVGLEGFEAAYPAQLSGGMQHRAALARALMCQPEMLLLDEPFAALDYFTRSTMQKEFYRIHRTTGMGGIFVTHNIDEAVLLGDRICIMTNGGITQCFRQPPSETLRDGLDARAIALKQEILRSLCEA